MSSASRDGKHLKTSTPWAQRSYTLRRADYAAALSDHGIELVRRDDMEGLRLGAHGGAGENPGRFDDDLQRLGWYTVLARRVG